MWSHRKLHSTSSTSCVAYQRVQIGYHHVSPATIQKPWHPACNFEHNQQDALYRLIYYSKSAVHVSGDVFAHHQEHLTLFTVSTSIHPSCCRLVSRRDGHGLDGPGIESRLGSIFRTCPDRPWAHPASCTMGTGSFPWVKSRRGVKLTLHLLLVPLVMKG
jgi:hypothetical protein